ncbi:hypothetical protein JYT51_01385 [Candidatus Amoebophilus asiaticus]|nr:hypothetical protein [Candidatus Amoebophilus asiaticus]
MIRIFDKLIEYLFKMNKMLFRINAGRVQEAGKCDWKTNGEILYGFTTKKERGY